MEDLLPFVTFQGATEAAEEAAPLSTEQLEGMTLPELKALATKLRLPEPEGDKRKRDTWVAALRGRKPG